MPIRCFFEVNEISKSEFHEIDYRLMRHVFDIQNELGRLYTESIYQKELLYRCEGDGIEGEILVTHGSFRKSFFIDALVGGGVVYELKAVESLDGQHESQLLNYLFLTRLQHGKLVNFSSPSVQHRFVTTGIGSAKRASFSINDAAWNKDDSVAGSLREIVYTLVNDWGVFLDINLYRQAIFHFLSGEAQLLSMVDITVDNRIIGSHKMHLLDQKTGLHISSVHRSTEAYRKQLIAMLGHTRLEKMQWINFCHDVIHLSTLKK